MKHDQAIMLQGTGANGKSILLQFIIALHGEENICSTSLQRICEDRLARGTVRKTSQRIC